MSIYLVKLSEFHNDTNEDIFETAHSIATMTRCHACGGRCRWKAAVAMHSLAYIGGEIWCSWECANSGKEYKMDKRQLRTLKRKMGKLYPNTLDLGKGFGE